MASTRGRTVVVPLTNKSGGAIIAGDVVIIDTSNDTAFTTTTSGQAEVTVGIAQESIASNATGRVLTAGYAALVNVPSSMTRGRYLETHTVVKQATGSATRRAGSFGQFLTAGTTPTAILWGQTDQTASGGASTLVGSRKVVTAGNYTTSSTSFVDVDATNMGITLTTGAHQVLIGATIIGYNSTNNTDIYFDVDIDGSRVGATQGLVGNTCITGNGTIHNFSFVYMTAALTAASHTFKLQYRVTGGTANIYANTTNKPLTFWVAEQGF